MTTSEKIPPELANHPDRFALSRIGMQVRRRLEQNPAAYKIDTPRAEIWAVGDFLDDRDCQKARDIIDAVARPSHVMRMEGQKWETYRDNFRTSYSGDVDTNDPFIRRVQRKIDDLLGIDPTFGETMQGQRYAVGQEFRRHFDWFPPDAPFWKREEARGGQRSFTAMIFLNDVEAGGVTDFPGCGVSVTPQKGALLLWNNATPEGVPNRWTLHAGCPVEAGTKYVITKWYRVRPWTPRL